ncbi:MAG: zinc-ribbon domain-containing protein [Ruminococcus sp.]|nr:zinc-ribbon domain-containing protein [Ruminococcus sp.]
MSKFCANCGTPLSEGANFCASCGAKVMKVVQPAPEPAPVPAPQPVAEPVAQPAPEPVAEPVPQPAPEPVVEPVVQPEPMPEPVQPVAEPEPVAEPVAKPVVEPVPQPVPEPVVEPVVQPEPIPEPVPEPQPVVNEKNPYNMPRSSDPGPFVAYTPSNAEPTQTAADMNAQPGQPYPQGQPYQQPNQPYPQDQPYYQADPNGGYGAPVQAQPKKKGNGLLIVILIVILLLLIGAGLLIYFIFFSSGGYQDAVEAYYEAMEDFEYDDFREAMGDTALIAYVEQGEGSDIQTFKLGCQRMGSLYKQQYPDVDVEYEILEVRKMSEDEVAEYDEYGLKGEMGYEIDVSTYTTGADNNGSDSETLTVIRYDGDWCVIDIASVVGTFIDYGELSDEVFDLYYSYSY